MIDIQDLTYAYGDNNESALKDINLKIRKGTLTLIAGATGSGKSTLLYCINGLIPRLFGGRFSGRIAVDGLAPQETSVAELSKTVGTVFQNPDTQIFMSRVEDDVAFGCENLGMVREETRKRRDDALKEMGLWEMRMQETAALSGGQKQRLAISSIYAMGPKVFLFDEPTTDLDLQGREEFLTILGKLKAQGHTIIIVEHHYDDILPMADQVVFLERGKILVGGVDDGNGSPVGKNGDSSRTAACPATKTRSSGAPVIVLEDLGFHYEKGQSVLEDINLTLRKGELAALCGHNGSGKSTLLKIMMGLLKQTQGQRTVLDRSNPVFKDLVGKVGFLFQNPDEQLFTNSVADEIAFGPKQLGRTVETESYLRRAGLDGLQDRHPQTLSRGQRQILAVLSVLAMEPDVVIFDEPTTGLDQKSWRYLFSLFHAMTAQGKTVVFTTHHQEARQLATRQISLQSGRIISDEVC